MRKRKYILIGSLLSIALPISAIISCGNSYPSAPNNTIINAKNYMKFSKYDYTSHTLTIDDNVIGIEPGAFKDYVDSDVKVYHLNLPNSLVDIIGGVFDTFNIKSINFGNSLLNIEDNAFSSALLTTLTIPNTVESIGSAAFYSSKLTTLIISDNIKSIGYGAISWFTNKTVNI